MSPVIAVSAPPGGGKTSLVRALARRLGATTLHFDDYEAPTRRPPGEILDWMRRGADWDALDLSRLARDLARLRSGARRAVLFDTPLGRRHAALARSIDFVIWIDVPLDIALARKIRDFTGWADADLRGWLATYLEQYLGGIREVIALQVEPVGGTYAAEVKAGDRVHDPARGTFGVLLLLDNPGYHLPAGIRCSVRFLGSAQ